LKYSVVIPCYKKGEKTKNFGPISLLTSFSRFLGKKNYIGLYKHVTESNLSVEQFGFKENSSMEKATYKLIKRNIRLFKLKKYR
jgi:hypothetical protein